MADNLSPLVNLDLINKIYKTINAQITERVYDPLYYPEATLGSEDNKYVEAYIRGNTSTGTLNGLTLAKATAGFTISGGETTSRTLTVADTATINKSLEVTAATSITGTLTVSAATNIIKGLTVGTTSTGAVTIQSSGAGGTTIEGPSGGTATFTAPTSDVPGSLQIKNNSYISTVSVAHGKTISTRSNLTVGESSNTGDVVIRPKSTYKLTITSNDTNATTAILRNGTCVITDDYAENNTASKLVKRDSNSNIKVTSVNKVAIDADTTANTNKIGLSKGTASITVTEAGLNVSKNLKVLAATTLGEKDTGDVIVKSASTGRTTIIGPSSGIAAFTTPANGNSGSLEIKNSDGTIKSTIKIASGKTVDAYSNLTVGDSSSNGNVIIKPSKNHTLTITGADADVSATLRSGTCVITDDYDEENVENKLVKRDGDKNINVTSINKVAIDANTTANPNKIALSKGTASITVAGADLNVNNDLTVSSTATLGGTNTGSVTVKSAGISTTTIVGPNGGTAELVSGLYTSSAITGNTDIPEVGKLLKIKNIERNTFLAGPTSGENDVPKYRQISSDDLTSVTAGSAKTVTANSYPNSSEASYYVTAVQNTGDNESLYASTEGVYIKRVNSTDSGSSDTTTSYHLYASAVHNAVWNDLADCIEVPEDTNLEFGYCYSWNGDKVEKTSHKSRNCIGIHSNTAGLFMGEKPVKTIQAAVAGFVLAHMDRAYPEGTPLTWGDDGKLVKCGVVKRILHPERVIATFYKEETQETWHGVKVYNRHWVKVR